MTQPVPIKIGDQLFQREDGSAFGAVVGVHAHELLVEIEGVGQAVIPAIAVKAVHDGKLIVDLAQLPPVLRTSIKHAHDRETE
ncbi:MAG: hypothetical protein ABUL62_33745 [Myxococcales bacterium]|jgi:hypothetical protein